MYEIASEQKKKKKVVGRKSNKIVQNEGDNMN